MLSAEGGEFCVVVFLLRRLEEGINMCGDGGFGVMCGVVEA
jgi:hypothetical protein